MDAARDRGRHSARGVVVVAARGAGRALCLRRVCEFRAAGAVAGSGVLVADRIVRAADPSAAIGQLAGTLSVDRSRRSALFSKPGEFGAARRGTRPAGHAR